MRNKLIYLAAPYSHSEKWIQEIRERIITAVTAKLTQKGHIIFSPITESHQYAKMYDLPGDWKFWENKDRTIISKCDELWVLLLKDWNKSKGVMAEIEIANELNIPVYHITPSSILEGYNTYLRTYHE